MNAQQSQMDVILEQISPTSAYERLSRARRAVFETCLYQTVHASAGAKSTATDELASGGPDRTACTPVPNRLERQFGLSCVEFAPGWRTVCTASPRTPRASLEAVRADVGEIVRNHVHLDCWAFMPVAAM